jgi:hypothetical protein
MQHNGVECKRIKEVNYLSTQKIDILLVSETHFKEQNYITHATSHPDWRTHAGSAIIVRKGIKHHELAKYETDRIQATNMHVSIEYWDVNLIKYIDKVNCTLKILLLI